MAFVVESVTLDGEGPPPDLPTCLTLVTKGLASMCVYLTVQLEQALPICPQHTHTTGGLGFWTLQEYFEKEGVFQNDLICWQQTIVSSYSF